MSCLSSTSGVTYAPSANHIHDMDSIGFLYQIMPKTTFTGDEYQNASHVAHQVIHPTAIALVFPI